MRPEELKMLLHSLLSNWEDEVVEFKRGGAGFSTGEIGEYFSALANEANLRCLPHAWLVFGVDNKTRKVVGTDYDASPEALNRSGGIKYQITQSTDPGVCFSDVHVLDLPEGRMPHLHISAKVAMMTGQEAAYMRKKERTGEQYRRIFIDFLRRFPGITRRKINEFMMEEIRGDLTEKQKRSKISNLMTGLRRNGKIVNKGSDKEPRWFYID